MKYLLPLFLIIGCAQISLAQSAGISHFTTKQQIKQLSELGNIKLAFSQKKSGADPSFCSCNRPILNSQLSAHLFQSIKRCNKEQYPDAAKQIEHHRLLKGLLATQSNEKAAYKTTTGLTFYRVIAQSTRDSTGAYADTVHLVYGPNRGSSYDYNDMIYPYNYAYNTSPMFNFAGIYTKPQVLFDSLRHWTINPYTNIYGPYETDIATYDAHENMITYKSMMKDSSIDPNRNYINKFNSVNDIDTALYFSYVGGVSDSAFRQFFAYNTSHLLIKDSIYEYHGGSWHLLAKTTYTYSGSNDLIQIDNYSNTTDTTFTLPLIEQIQYINTYDASHRLLTVASSFYNGTTFGPYVRDTFAYSGTYTWHNSWKEYQYDPINGYWAPMMNMTKTINLSGQPDTVYIQGFDSLLNAWVPQTKEVIHYNGNHYPDTLKEYDYNFTAYPTNPSYKTIYYYQTYLNSLETNSVPANIDGASIYPNPVKNQFTIARLNVSNGTGIYVSIINASGQIVTRQAMTWQAQTQISMQDMIPGRYWVIIQDGAGKMLHRQAVVKE